MDKFGIFKLLNSFFNFYEQSKENSLDNSSPFKVENLFSSPKEKEEKRTENTKSLEATNAPPAPLQSYMLYTMSSHDEFVKRVKEKLAKPLK